MDNTNITPQGYTYAIAPNTTHPFWKDSSGDSNYIYAPLKNPVVFENTDKNFTRFNAVLQGDVPFIAPLTLSLVSVTINSEVALPFVGVSHGDVAFLICEGIETNQLKVVGVYATTDMSALEIKNIISIPAPIKGDKGDNGQDGVTPEITATATVDQTTGNATVNVTKTGTDTNPAFNFAFTGLKGERGERGEQGQAGANGNDGVTPHITATASVDQTTGNATVNVTKTGTDTHPEFSFAFTGLKGERGERGQAGANGNDGATGATGVTPDITVNATVDETTGTPSVQVTKSGTLENPVFNLAFSGLKGEGGSGGEWHREFCGDGATLGNLIKTLQDSGIDECYITYAFKVTDNTSIDTEFVAYKPYDGTTESFTLGKLGSSSVSSLRGVHYCLEKRQMGDDIMLSWNAVGYQFEGYVAEFHSEDSSKQVQLPMSITPPFISANMTEFNSSNANLETYGGTCFLTNSNNYSSFIINITNFTVFLVPTYAVVFYRG